MVKLPILVTTTQVSLDGAVQENLVTDTLYVSSVNINFNSGIVYATVQRGTTTNGQFTSNYPTLYVAAKPDGSFFSSTNPITTVIPPGGPNSGPFSGVAGTVNISPIVNSLSSQFDSFLSGVISVYQSQGVK